MLTLFHDYTSPTSAVAVRRAQRLADEGLDITFEGFEAIGIDMVLPVTVDVLAEVERVGPLAAEEGVALARPAQLPPTTACHAVARVAAETGARQAAAWRSAAYGAFWRRGADLSSREVLLRLAEEAGLDASVALRALDDRTALVAVRQRTAQLRRNGVGGVPTILSQRTLIPGLLPEEDLRALAAL